MRADSYLLTLIWITFLLALAACQGDEGAEVILPDTSTLTATAEPIPTEPTEVISTETPISPTAAIGLIATSTPFPAHGFDEGEATPGQTITPTSTPRPTRTPTPDLTATSFMASLPEWTLYTNETMGISFEYPTRFDYPPKTQCSPHFRESPDTLGVVTLGVRISIVVLDAESMSLDEFLTETFSREDLFIQEQQPATISSASGQYIQYRYGSMGRFAEMYIVEKWDRFYVLQSLWGDGCDDTVEARIGEHHIFVHMVNTFAFIEG